jgi:hypothetical protein
MTITVTNATRRAVLTVAASLAVATLGLSLAAADPIHELITQHAAACQAHDIAAADCLLNIAPGSTRTLEQQRIVSDRGYAAWVAEFEATKALGGVATTADGLRALARHRAVARHRAMDWLI